jgi:polysaccharide export outer membrane protein
MKKIYFFIMLLLFCSVIYSQQTKFTQNQLDSDLRYYYKTYQQKNFSPNDRLYFLNKLYEKYKNSGLNLTKLEQEISIVKNELKQQSAEISTQVQKLEPKTGQKPTTNDITEQKNYLIDDYKISAGDILFVRVSPSEDLSKEVVVSPDGKIVFPLIGTIKIDGYTIKEAEQIIQKNLAVYITQPKVSISVKLFSKKQVFILGEVKNPGGYSYKDGMKLFELISLAGGITQYAGTKNIKIYRGEKKEQKFITVNLDEIITDTSKDFPLLPGDIVEVPKQPKSISVIGEVTSPGIYDWHEQLDIIEALSLAKGYTATAKLSSVKIFRQLSNGEKQVINVNVAEILKGKLNKNFVLEPGDVVYVPKKPLVSGSWFVNTVLPWVTLMLSILLLMAYFSK